VDLHEGNAERLVRIGAEERLGTLARLVSQAKAWKMFSRLAA
jgi:hypothetical protein